MANPVDGISGVQLQTVTEATSSGSSAGVTTIDTGGCEKIEIVNKGPNTVYFRTDGSTPTSGAAGNADQIPSGGWVALEGGTIKTVKLICAATETATVFSRLYS